MRRLIVTAALGAAVAVAASPAPWEEWLTNFGRDAYAYPSWIVAQKRRCSCSVDLPQSNKRSVKCTDANVNVEWQNADDLTWCTAMHFLLSHMPEFDLHFLPGSVSVEGESMLDDNVAFSLMAWNASSLSPRPPLKVVLPYLLPYATYHEPRENWRPILFAKYIVASSGLQSSESIVDSLIQNGTRLMNWTAFQWAGFHGGSPDNAYELGPFASGSSPPVVGVFDFTAYGYASCTGWAKFLASALKAVGVPAREVGSPCWNTAIFTGLATANPNVSQCWGGGPPNGPFGGTYLNNHNWVEYWDNKASTWKFLDIGVSTSAEKTWFCGTYGPNGCECSSNAGKSSRDHDIFAPTWSDATSDFDGGDVLDSADLRLSTGESVSPLVWSPRLRSPLGKPLKNIGLRLVNRTSFYRCKTNPSMEITM